MTEPVSPTPKLGMTLAPWDGAADIRTINQDLAIIDTAFGTVPGDMTVGQDLHVVRHLTVGGNTTLTGPLAAQGGVTFPANTAGAAGSLYKTAVDGLAVRGVTGSTNDLVLVNAAGAIVARNPTGTQDLVIPGNLTVVGVTSPTTPGDLIARSGAASQVTVGAVGANPGLLLGTAGDTNVYRAAANTLATDDALQVGGTAYIGDTSNASSTLGLTINQGPADNEILSLKSSDIAHGLTGVTETDTFGLLAKTSPTVGGLRVVGIQESTVPDGANGLLLEGQVVSNASTLKSGGGPGIINLRGYVGGVTPNADGNLVAIQSGNATKIIFDAEGDAHQDGTGWTTYDDHDDVALLDALDTSLDARLRASVGPWLQENKRALEAARIVAFNDDPGGVPFVNHSRLQMLLVGAIRQLGTQLAQTRAELAAVRAMLPAGP